MKLSDLELLVVSMRARSGPSANPNVTFWDDKREDLIHAANSGRIFVEFDFAPGCLEEVHSHRVATDGNMDKAGDYTFPLSIRPYKR